MVDWNGVMKWSTKYHDPSMAGKHTFAPLTEEKKKFLEAVMEDYSFRDIKKIQAKIEKLSAPETGQDC